MRVALTQSEGRLAELETLLREQGFEVVRQPLIRTRTLPGVSLEPLQGCRWWLFTSAAAVRAILELGGSLAGRRLGVVGEATAQAAEEAGGRIELQSPEASASRLADAFIAGGETGPVGLPQGDRALPTLSARLKAAGHVVCAVTVYHTEILPWPDDLAVPDITLVASPSAVEGLSEDFARKTRFVAIGSTTAERLRERGWPHLLSGEASVRGVLEAISSLEGQSSF